MSGWCGFLSPLIEVISANRFKAFKPRPIQVVPEYEWFEGEKAPDSKGGPALLVDEWCESENDITYDYNILQSVIQSAAEPQNRQDIRTEPVFLDTETALKIELVNDPDLKCDERLLEKPHDEYSFLLEEYAKIVSKSNETSSELLSEGSIGYDNITETLKTLIEKIEEAKSNVVRIKLTNTAQYNVIREVAMELGMKIIKARSKWDWDVLWTIGHVTVEGCKKFRMFQRVNHFPLSGFEMNKMSLARNLDRMIQVFPDEYNFVPETWCFPSGLNKMRQYAAMHKNEWFILKPADGSCGRGIVVTRNANEIEKYRQVVCQLYIRRPFLIDGYKFDLRVFTLITSCHPLRIFVYNEGLARFATEKYEEPNSENASNKYMHLTNSSVNKNSPSYIIDEVNGSARKMSTVDNWFMEHNVDSKKIWDSMDDAIIKTIIVILPALRHYYRLAFPDHVHSNACFEIFGFDIMFNVALKPYVLEVNCSPNYSTEVPLKHEIKKALMRDTFEILQLPESQRRELLVEEKKRSLGRLFSQGMTRKEKENLRREKLRRDQKLTQSRIEWENSHMGNYRKIYPHERIQQYDKFISASQDFFLRRINI